MGPNFFGSPYFGEYYAGSVSQSVNQTAATLTFTGGTQSFWVFGAFVQTATAIDVASGTSTTIGGAGWGSNITAGNIIVVGVRVGNVGTSASVTSDQSPTTFTKAVEQQQTTDGHTASIHYGVSQTGAVKPTITISNPSGGSIRAVAVEYMGSSNTHLDKIASAQGSSTAPSSGVTATRSDATELQVGLESNASGFSATAGSGFTVRGTQPANKLAIEDVMRRTTGTDVADFTITSDNWTANTATFSDSGAASVSITQAAATLTFTGGTQATTVQSPQATATLTFTGGTQAVASSQLVAITQAAATLTFTGGTQVVATVNDVSIAQIGATLTFTGGTQAVASVNNVAIAQVAATLTFNGGTQAFATVNDVSIAQTAAVLTFNGGTQAVATIRNVSIAQVGATLTFTGGTQVVATVNNVAISQVAAVLTFNGGVQVISSSGSSTNVAQLAATLTFTGGTQAVTAHSGTRNYVVLIDGTIAPTIRANSKQLVPLLDGREVLKVGANLYMPVS